MMKVMIYRGGTAVTYDLVRILSGMTDEEPAVRLSAAMALEQAIKEEWEGGRTEWGPLVEQVLPALILGIGDDHKGVQVHSANCLEFLSYHSEAVIPALRAAMGGTEAWRAWGAALVAARLGLWLPEMARALSGAMGSQDRDVRWAAAGFTLQMGRKHPDAVTMAKQALQSPNPTLRKMAAYCLGAMGAYADVEEPLTARLADPHRDVRRAAILALLRLPCLSPAAVSRIAALRSDPDEYVRRTAHAAAARNGA